MENKKKLLTILGTRPEIIKMSCVLEKFKKYFNSVVVHTGQNHDYYLNNIFFKQLKITKPDYFLNCAKKSSIQTISSVLEKIEKVLIKEKPDAVAVYGDTNSCLSVIAAKKLKIPIFHFEAGNRSFDQNVPEEINRKIVDHLSDVNFVLTEHARRNLLNEGLPTDRIFKTGSHLFEVLEKYKFFINNSKILIKEKLKYKGYILYSFHREENVDNIFNLKKIIQGINFLARKKKMPIIVSTHPRTRKKILNYKFDKLVKFKKPFGFIDYVFLQKSAYCVVSDSGTITEESALLNFPAITLRKSHERPEGMDNGILIMSGLEPKNVFSSIEIVVDIYKKTESKIEIVDNMNNFPSNQIVKVITSYIDYINENVWKKYS
jgi:UDP-N-acetylglucosamine 2-epimerase